MEHELSKDCWCKPEVEVPLLRTFEVEMVHDTDYVSVEAETALEAADKAERENPGWHITAVRLVDAGEDA